jgi:hypothetical protein
VTGVPVNARTFLAVTVIIAVAIFALHLHLTS